MNVTQNPENGRGCGSRTEGSPYLCCGKAENELLIEHFIVDPPHLWHRDFQRGYYIAPRNPKDKNSPNDIIIFVGRQFYPSPWSFIEEVRNFGASRKIPKNFPFDKLTAGQSRMVFVHSKVIPDNFEFRLFRDVPLNQCAFVRSFGWDITIPGYHPIDNTICTFGHRDLSFMLHGKKDIVYPPMEHFEKYPFQVNMPSFSWEGLQPIQIQNANISEKKWRPAIFLALSLTHIEYCQQADRESSEAANEAGFEIVTLDY